MGIGDDILIPGAECGQQPAAVANPLLDGVFLGIRKAGGIGKNQQAKIGEPAIVYIGIGNNRVWNVIGLEHVFPTTKVTLVFVRSQVVAGGWRAVGIMQPEIV